MKYSKTFLFLVACSLPFMVLVVAGLSLYLSNRNEITFSISDIVLPLAGFFLVAAVILFFILLLLRKFKRSTGFVLGLLTGLSLAVWAQSQLFLWNFGQFNGQMIPWENLKMNMYIDGSTWIVLIAAGIFVFYRGRPKTEKGLLAAIYILGTMSVLISFFIAPEKTKRERSGTGYEDVFTFHPEKNTLVIMLDGFQADYFEKIVKQFPGEIKEFDGFTFFRNTVSRFPSTKASEPSIVTGTVYRNEETFQDYISKSFRKFNIMSAYEKRSYTISYIGSIPFYSRSIPMQTVVNDMSKAVFNPFLEYLDYALFRALPTVAKPAIYNDGDWFCRSLFLDTYPPELLGADVRFLELFEKNASVKQNKAGSFKFLHFYIPHAPYRVNEDLHFDQTLSGEKGYFRQARGAVKLTGRIFKKLKELGIYNKADIVVLSDHGQGGFGADNPLNAYYSALGLPPKIQGYSHALLLRKPPYSTGEIAISDWPLELTDLACLLGLHADEKDCQGYNLARSGGERVRLFYYYEWQHKFWNSEYLPPITEYIIDGDVQNPASFKPGKAVYYPGEVRPESMPAPSEYRLGDEIRFTKDNIEGLNRYIRGGWSPPEPDHCWSDGPAAGLTLKLTRIPEKNLVLRLAGYPFLGDNTIDQQPVTVMVNSTEVDHWNMKESGWYRAVIPASLVSDGTVNIVFVFGHTISPSDLKKESKDTRNLGIGVTRIVLVEEQ